MILLLVKTSIMEISNKSKKVYPFVDKLVDSLFTEELNKLIESENVKEDKNTFMMFITMYFTIKTHSENFSKNDLKNFMTELIRDPEKRLKCIELFSQMNYLISPKKENLRIL